MTKMKFETHGKDSVAKARKAEIKPKGYKVIKPYPGITDLAREKIVVTKRAKRMKVSLAKVSLENK